MLSEKWSHRNSKVSSHQANQIYVCALTSIHTPVHTPTYILSFLETRNIEMKPVFKPIKFSFAHIHTSWIFPSPFMRRNLIVVQQSSSAIRLFKHKTIMWIIFGAEHLDLSRYNKVILCIKYCSCRCERWATTRATKIQQLFLKLGGTWISSYLWYLWFVIV